MPTGSRTSEHKACQIQALDSCRSRPTVPAQFRPSPPLSDLFSIHQERGTPSSAHGGAAILSHSGPAFLTKSLSAEAISREAEFQMKKGEGAHGE